MGYYVNTRDVNFRIPANKSEDAYRAVCALNERNDIKTGGAYPRTNTETGPNPDVWFAWMDWNYPETCPDLRAVLDQIGYDTWVDEDGSLVILGYNSKTGAEDVFLSALAPFAVAEGPATHPFVDWEGEDGERWRNVVHEGRLYCQNLAVVAVGDPVLYEPRRPLW